jgi:hypothetical protein
VGERHGGLITFGIVDDAFLKIVKLDQNVGEGQEKHIIVGYFFVLDIYFVQNGYDFLFLLELQFVNVCSEVKLLLPIGYSNLFFSNGDIF